MMQSFQTKPYMLNNEEGQCLHSLGTQISIKATSEQTGGVFNVFEVCCPPDYATPLHIHYTEDVAVYILEGALIFFCGSEKKVAEEGSFFFQPPASVDTDSIKPKWDDKKKLFFVEVIRAYQLTSIWEHSELEKERCFQLCNPRRCGVMTEPTGPE